MVRIIEMMMYYGTNKKPGEIPYARYKVLKYMINTQFATAKESDSCRITVALV
jgi:hypothetical protein